MPLTRGKANKQRKRELRNRRRSRRKTSHVESLTIDRLPDAILGCVANYLRKSSQAIFAVAISTQSTKVNCSCWNNEPWETLDFADLEQDLAPKLTDEDLHGILTCIDAAKRLKTLKLTGCINIIGHGLRTLRRSVALRQIDLSFVGLHESPTLNPEPMISKAIVIPTFNRIVDTFGNTLKHIQLPKKWRMEHSPMMDHFLAKYNECLNNRYIGCSKCDNVIWGGIKEKQWIVKGGGPSGGACGLQDFTCYQCTNRFCLECEIENAAYFCQTCEKKFCTDCAPTRRCTECGDVACSECKTMLHCDGCHNDLCEDCMPVLTCSLCDRDRCLDCLPFNECQGKDCLKMNCTECGNVVNVDANRDSVQWCVVCERDFCSDCRLKEYHKNRTECCWGCCAILLPRLVAENESLRQRLEELQNRELSV